MAETHEQAFAYTKYDVAIASALAELRRAREKANAMIERAEREFADAASAAARRLAWTISDLARQEGANQ